MKPTRPVRRAALETHDEGGSSIYRTNSIGYLSKKESPGLPHSALVEREERMMNYIPDGPARWLVDGSITGYPPANGKTYSLEELQAAVEGLIEIIPIPDRPELLMVVNEYGLFLKLPMNEWASEVAQRGIVGAVLVCPKEMLE